MWFTTWFNLLVVLGSTQTFAQCPTISTTITASPNNVPTTAVSGTTVAALTSSEYGVAGQCGTLTVQNGGYGEIQPTGAAFVGNGGRVFASSSGTATILTINNANSGSLAQATVYGANVNSLYVSSCSGGGIITASAAGNAYIAKADVQCTAIATQQGTLFISSAELNIVTLQDDSYATISSMNLGNIYLQGVGNTLAGGGGVQSNSIQATTTGLITLQGGAGGNSYSLSNGALLVNTGGGYYESGSAYTATASLSGNYFTFTYGPGAQGLFLGSGGTATVQNGALVTVGAGVGGTVSNGGAVFVNRDIGSSLIVGSGGTATLQMGATVTAASSPSALITATNPATTITQLGSYQNFAVYSAVVASGGNRKRRDALPMVTAGVCPRSKTFCPRTAGIGSSGFACIDSENDIFNCGGCTAAGSGVDCTAITDSEVRCERGICVVEDDEIIGRL